MCIREKVWGGCFIRLEWTTWSQEVCVPFNKKKKRCWIPRLIKRCGSSNRQLEMERRERMGSSLKWVRVMNFQAPKVNAWVCYIKEKVSKCVKVILMTKWLRMGKNVQGGGRRVVLLQMTEFKELLVLCRALLHMGSRGLLSRTENEGLYLLSVWSVSRNPAVSSD